MTVLGERIVDTLAYHGLFAFPLTAHEVRMTLPPEEGSSSHAVIAELSSLEEAGLVGSKDGLWHLAEREKDVAERKRRYDLAERKYRIAGRFFRFARHAPFLRAVYVCNTLSRSNAREGSDIDLYLVTDPGRVWTVRFFVTGLAKLLGARPNRETSKDKLCLSFFTSSDALDVRDHAIENDVYLPHWLFDLYPVYDESGITGKIFAENAWARDRISGLRKQIASHRRVVGGAKGPVKGALERILRHDIVESSLKRLQMRVMPGVLKESARKGEGVVISDSTLKLHSLDRRAEIRDRFVSATSMKKEEYARSA